MADLIAALWDASYKGVPFWIDRDEWKAGRRIVTSEFPYSDEPFNEDLGGRAHRFHVIAYVASDDYVAQSAALMGACNIAGAGTLVLPTFGPVLVRNGPAERTHAKDRIGFSAFTIEFVREGATSALGSSTGSVGYRRQLAVDAADGAQAAAAGLARRLRLDGQPAFVTAAAATGLEDAVAGLDAIRVETPVEPLASARIAGTLADLYAAIPAAIAAPDTLGVTVATPLVAAARDLAAALPAATAAAAFRAALDDVVMPQDAQTGAALTATPARLAAAANAALAARLARLALATAYVDSVVRATYAGRPDGVTARAALVERLDAEMALCLGAPDEALFLALTDLRDAAVAYLSALIVTLAPVMTVSTNIPLPSLALAWQLYADPLRAPELVARNGVRHPSFMPTRIEALAPPLKRAV